MDIGVEYKQAVCVLPTNRIGGNNHGKGRNCYKHAALGNIPSWGGGNNNYGFRQYLCCSRAKNSVGSKATTKFFDSSNSGYKNTMSWAQAKEFCVASGFQNLCTSKQCE